MDVIIYPCPNLSWYMLLDITGMMVFRWYVAFCVSNYQRYGNSLVGYVFLLYEACDI